MMPLTDDVRAIIEAAHLCFAATVTPDGKPNLSPKGTIRVWDDRHVFFLDIASPKTWANLECNPSIELNVVDALSRRGYRLSGHGYLHRDDQVFQEATRRVFVEDGTTYPVRGVVLVEVQSATALVSPGYRQLPDEASMRALWKHKRAKLDASFEDHVTKLPFTP
jgi:predicted pyridoxine 5'-phosphate oxidase superfamily flavin-nucleotide-binding protein